MESERDKNTTEVERSLTIHSIGEPWTTFLEREPNDELENLAQSCFHKKIIFTDEQPIDDRVNKFPYSDKDLYGTRPITEMFVGTSESDSGKKYAFILRDEGLFKFGLPSNFKTKEGSMGAPLAPPNRNSNRSKQKHHKPGKKLEHHKSSHKDTPTPNNHTKSFENTETTVSTPVSSTTNSAPVIPNVDKEKQSTEKSSAQKHSSSNSNSSSNNSSNNNSNSNSSGSSTNSSSNKSSKSDRRTTRIKERKYDPDRHCGVMSENTHRHCTYSLTCKKHSVPLRRQVEGRSKPFDELINEHKTSGLRSSTEPSSTKINKPKKTEYEFLSASKSGSNSSTDSIEWCLQSSEVITPTTVSSSGSLPQLTNSQSSVSSTDSAIHVSGSEKNSEPISEWSPKSDYWSASPSSPTQPTRFQSYPTSKDPLGIQSCPTAAPTSFLGLSSNSKDVNSTSLTSTSFNNNKEPSPLSNNKRDTVSSNSLLIKNSQNVSLPSTKKENLYNLSLVALPLAGNNEVKETMPLDSPSSFVTSNSESSVNVVISASSSLNSPNYNLSGSIRDPQNLSGSSNCSTSPLLGFTASHKDVALKSVTTLKNSTDSLVCATTASQISQQNEINNGFCISQNQFVNLRTLHKSEQIKIEALSTTIESSSVPKELLVPNNMFDKFPILKLLSANSDACDKESVNILPVSDNSLLHIKSKIKQDIYIDNRKLKITSRHPRPLILHSNKVKRKKREYNKKNVIRGIFNSIIKPVATAATSGFASSRTKVLYDPLKSFSSGILGGGIGKTSKTFLTSRNSQSSSNQINGPPLNVMLPRVHLKRLASECSPGSEDNRNVNKKRKTGECAHIYSQNSLMENSSTIVIKPVSHNENTI